jgi:hypothetical protein
MDECYPWFVSFLFAAYEELRLDSRPAMVKYNTESHDTPIIIHVINSGKEA